MTYRYTPEEIGQLNATIDRLRAALKPFAKLAEDERSRMPDISAFESVLVSYYLLRDAANVLTDEQSGYDKTKDRYYEPNQGSD